MSAKNQPKKHFNTVLYTGTGSEQNIGGLDFSPDLVWMKVRNDSFTHQLLDTVRGTKQRLSSNSTNSEASSETVLSFNTDGFTLGTEQAVNGSGKEYVAWCWNAGDTTKTIAVGELNSEAYDQSQTWSAQISSTGTVSSISQGFDGSIVYDAVGGANYSGINCGVTATITWNVPAGLTGPVRIFGTPANFQYGFGSTITASNGFNQLDNTGDWVYIGEAEDLTSVTVSSNNSDYGAKWQAIEVNGIILVDTSVTPPNIPSIETTVRANPDAGFSVAKYTGTSASSSSIAHGLGSQPQMVIIKQLNSDGGWLTQHVATKLGSGRLWLDDTSDVSYTSSTNYWNDSPPNSFATFIGGGNQQNSQNGSEYVVYSFSQIPGYSIMGSYLGNGTLEGEFVNCGFEPQFILLKSISGTYDWCINDNRRQDEDPGNTRLSPNLADGEKSDAANDYRVEFLSNGFKIRGNNTAQNAGSNLYLYYAISGKSINKPTLEKVMFDPDVYDTWDRKQYDFAVGDEVKQVGSGVRETGDITSVTTNSNGSVTLVVSNDIGTFDIGDVLTQGAQTGTIIGLDEGTNSITVIPD